MIIFQLAHFLVPYLNLRKSRFPDLFVRFHDNNVKGDIFESWTKCYKNDLLFRYVDHISAQEVYDIKICKTNVLTATMNEYIQKFVVTTVGGVSVCENKLGQLLQISSYRISVDENIMHSSSLLLSANPLGVAHDKMRLISIVDVNVFMHRRVLVASGVPQLYSDIDPRLLLNYENVIIADVTPSSSAIFSKDCNTKYEYIRKLYFQNTHYKLNLLENHQPKLNNMTKIDLTSRDGHDVFIASLRSIQDTSDEVNNSSGNVFLNLPEFPSAASYSDMSPPSYPSVHVIGIVARKKAVTKQLAFLTLIPPTRSSDFNLPTGYSIQLTMISSYP